MRHGVTRDKMASGNRQELIVNRGSATNKIENVMIGNDGYGSTSDRTCDYGNFNISN